MTENIRKHPLYTVWKGMRARCHDPNHASAKRYYERGIDLVSEWDDYKNFYEWSIANGYKYGLAIDRIDNDGMYSPENCRWVTHKVNANNTSKNLVLEAFGEFKSASEWSDDIRCAVPLNTLYQRIENGWGSESAIITPSKRKSTGRPLTFDWYQAVAETTAIYPGKGAIEGLSYAVLGLTSECGEVAGKVKKLIRDFDGQMPDDKRKEIASELSDVLWYCAAIANELGLSLGKIAENNLEKLADRMERNAIKGEGDNR